MGARRWIILAGIMVFVCAAAGCATVSRMPSYDRSQFQVMISSETIGVAAVARREEEVQKEVERFLALEPGSPAPQKVLLYEVPSGGPSKIKSSLKWIELRRDTSLRMKEALEETGIFEEVSFLPEFLLPSDAPGDLRTVRIAAARAQADAILIYATESGYEYKPNPLSPLYATIVGCFLVPGSTQSAMSVSKAVLVDVRTGYMYLNAETYGKESKTRPVGLVSTEELELGSRTKALAELSQAVAEKVRGLRKTSR